MEILTRRSILAIVLGLLPLSGPAAETNTAQSIPDIRLEKIADGFTHSLYLIGSGDGRRRLFVVEQEGVIRILDPSGNGNHAVFLDLRDRVKSGGEKGLLSVAFHPQFARNRRLFVDYTTGKRGDLWTHISEFRAADDLNTADPQSERVLLRFKQPHENHNGGLVLFGPDNYLYIGNGDGGSANDPYNNGQRLDTFLAKMLRIDVDPSDTNRLYDIPSDNPFVIVKRGKALPEIYAYGLRNPWRFSFDRLTGRLYVADVGQYHREEIDIVEKGGNYGWRIMEGAICTPGVNRNCDSKGLIPPILDYGRKQGISVTGGYVYRGTTFPGLHGVYLYGDYGSGNLWGLRYNGERVVSQRLLLTTGLPIASFGEDEAGEIYVVSHSGSILRIVPAQETH